MNVLVWSVLTLLLGIPTRAPAQAGIPYLADPSDESEQDSPKADTSRGADEDEEIGKRHRPRAQYHDEDTRDAEADESTLEPEPAFEPKHTPATFAMAWNERRAALAANEIVRAQSILDDIIEKKAMAGWPNMFAYAEAVARESRRALDSGAIERASKLARAAVALAPHRPVAHVALARAAWAGGERWAAIGAFFKSYWLSWTEPPMVRGRLTNLMLVVVVGLLVACALFAGIVIFRHVRLLVHDLHHLLPSGATRLQSSLFGAALLAAPLFFRLGPGWTILTWITVFGLYYDRGERAGAILVAAVLAMFPLLLPWLTSHYAYPDSRAEAAYLAARDMGAEGAARRLEATSKPSTEELFILGLRARWSGNLDVAADRLSRAERAGCDDPALLTTLGNVKFQLGDADGAIQYYQKAIKADPEHVVAHFNLSRVYYTQADHARGRQAHNNAQEIDLEAVEAMKKVATQAGPNYVVKEKVPRYLVSACPIRDPKHERAIRQLWRWVGGRLTPRFHFAAAAFVTVVILVSLTFLRQLLRPSSACPRCGMAACRRCNPEMPDQHLCGQCFHSFVSLEGVDPQSRVKKEIEVHRFQARSLRVRRVVSLMIVGAGQLLVGRSLVGVLLLAAFVASVLGAFLAAGIIPDPAPYAAPASSLSGILAWLIAVTVYGAGLWDAQRSEGG